MSALPQLQDRIGFGVAVMVFTDLVLSVADAIIKVTLSEMPLSQFVFLRSCTTMPILIFILKWRFAKVSLLPAMPRWAVLRSALLLASLLLYYASLPRIDLALAAAVYYTIPLFITLFAAVWIREPVGFASWIGVVVGFGGVMLMLKPDAGKLDFHALMPLASAILYAVAMVITRTKARAENPFVLAIVFNLMAIIIGGGGGILSLIADRDVVPGTIGGDWLSLGGSDWALMLMLSCMMLIGSVGTAIAYQSAPPAIISTWDFSYLAFAVLWGVIFFNERLDFASLVGIGLIALAGITVVRR